VGQLVPPEIGYKKPPKQERQFAADTAERTGQSKKDINRHVSRAEALGDDLDAAACPYFFAPPSQIPRV